MALPPIQKNWGLFYFNSKPNFRQSGFLAHSLLPACRHLSCQDRTMNEWILMNTKDVARAIFSCYCCRVGGEKEGERRRPLDPLGLRKPSPYSEYSLWSSERDINLTLRLWAFICLWEMRSAAQMTVPILQIPLTVGVHTHIHTLTFAHTCTHSTHSRASATFPSLCIPGFSSSGVWTRRSWLRKQSQLCQQLRVKNKKYTMAVWAEATPVYIG